MLGIRVATWLTIVVSLCTPCLHAQDTIGTHEAPTARLLTGDRAVRELGAAVTVLDVDSLLREFPARTLSELLTGRVPGVEVLPSSGTMGTGSRIQIRGAGSVTATNAPQIYVDGIRVDDEVASLTVPVGGQTTSRVDDLDVDAIATITVLPGPSATALYGTDAANGVLLITTKRGGAGASRLRAFTSQGVVSQAAAFPDNFQAVDSSGAPCTITGVASGACHLLRSNVLEHPGSSPFRDGYLRQYGLSASGGNARRQFSLAGQWDGFGGVYGLPGPEQSQLSATGGLTAEVLNPNYVRRANLRASGQLFAGGSADLALTAGYFSGDLRLPINDNSTAGLLASGMLGSGDTTVNRGWGTLPPSDLFRVVTSEHAERVSTSLAGTWHPRDFFTARATVGLDRASQHDTQVHVDSVGGASSFLADNQLQSNRYTATITATATYQVGARVSARTTAGAQYFRHSDELLFTNHQTVGGAPGGGGSVTSVVGDSSVAHTIGVLIEQQLAWGQRLFLTGSVRRDATTRFGASDPAAVYPHVGVAWHPSMGAGSPVGSLRLRAAYGVAGRQAAFAGMAPERTREIEGGIDAELLAGRAAFGVTLYSRRTSHLLVAVPLAPSVGGGLLLPDAGVLSNKGMELMLAASVVRRPGVTWDVTVSAWGNRNRVLTGGPAPVVVSGGLGVLQVAQAGLPLGSYWGVPIVGYADANGDGVIVPGEVRLGGTEQFLGNPFPTQGGSLSTALAVRQHVRLAALLEYRGGNSLLNSTELIRCLSDVCRAANDPSAPLADQVARAAAGAGTAAGWVENARFLKVREVSLSLIAPACWAAHLGAADMALTVSGRNLATWTSYRGLDPEVNASGPEGLTREDLFTQPLARYWTARLDLSF